jgi:hypothetical protein
LYICHWSRALRTGLSIVRHGSATPETEHSSPSLKCDVVEETYFIWKEKAIELLAVGFWLLAFGL